MLDFPTLITAVPQFSTLTQRKQVEWICGFYYLVNKRNEFVAKDIETVFIENHLSTPANISRELVELTKARPQLIIRRKSFYSLELSFKSKLEQTYLDSPYKSAVSDKLKDLIPQIRQKSQQDFLADAIKCLDGGIQRAAIILTWLLTMDILMEFTLSNKRAAFNSELHKKNKKIQVNSKADFEDLKEGEIIELLRAAAVISKEQKKILDEKLNIRNSAAHPNMTLFKEAKTITFIEELLDEFIIKFQ